MAQPGVGDYLLRLNTLIAEGRSLGARLRTDSASSAIVRSWQEQCATAINELSGDSKAHWLSRAFSDAFLVRSNTGEAIETAPLTQIVERIVHVLDQGRESLVQMAAASAPSTGAPRPPRFGFVHNAQLRPVLEQAYAHGRTAFEEGRFAESLVTMCGVLEAILTDALEHSGRDPRDWSFQARIDAAEQAGLIRGGCARLPAIARRYRDVANVENEPAGASVGERDARTTSQVLQIVMRDLDPGR